MKRSHLIIILCMCVIAFITTASNAALFDRGGGLIYDSGEPDVRGRRRLAAANHNSV